MLVLVKPNLQDHHKAHANEWALCWAWTLVLVKDDNNFLVAEKKFLRISGPVQRVDNNWRVRTNAKLEELVVKLNIIAETKACRLSWVGHLEGLKEDRNVKRAHLVRPTERRPVAPPGIVGTTPRIGSGSARTSSQCAMISERLNQKDQRKWRNLVSEAKTCFGSLSQHSKQVTFIWN